MISRRHLLATAAATPVLARFRFAHAADYIAYTYLPAETLHGAAGLIELVDEIRTATDGTLDIVLNLGGSLPISATDITQAVGEGVISIAGDGFFSGAVPAGGLLRLPMLLTTPAHYDAALAIVRPLLAEGFDRQGVTVLGNYRYPLQVIWSTSTFTGLADMEGKRMRVTSAEQGEFVTRLGGTPVTIASAEVTPALQRGVVDGVFTASIAGGNFWREMLTHSYRLGPNYFDSMIIANADMLAALDADHRALLEDAAARVGGRITQAMADAEPPKTEELAAGGMTVTEPTDADIETARTTMAGYWTDWADEHGETIRAALDEIRTTLEL